MSFNITANPFNILRHAHPRMAGRIVYFGGGASSEPVDQTITQVSIPDEFMPYYERLLERSEAQSLEPYQAYEGERIAESGDFADINASRDMTRDIAGQGIAGLAEAQQTAQGNIARAAELGQYDTGQFSQFGFDPARQFTGAEAQSYMSPYIQNVLEVQKSRAVEDFERMRGGRNAQAVSAGAFGGSRQAVQEGMAEEALLKNMAAIDASGYQGAYDRAGQLFSADRDAQFATQQAQAGELGRVQTGTEASRQFGAGQGLAALQAGGAAANQLVGYGQQERAADIQGAQMLEGIGRSQQQEAQAGLDIGYQDYLRQQSYPQEQLAFQSNILQGVPISPASSVTQTGYQYSNPLQQAIGAGLTGYSLYQAYQ